MKQGTIFTRIAMLVLFLGLAAYMGFAVWNRLTDPFSSTLAYEYTADDSVEVSGMLVRAEQVLEGQSGIVDLCFDEGEKVGNGQTVAYLYQTDEALERKHTIRALERETEQLQYAMSQTDATSNARLDETIIQQVVDLRADCAQQDFTDLEDEVLDLKSTVLKRDYTYGGADGAAALQQQLAGVQEQLQTLRSQADTDTRTVTAPVSGVFSALVDGYETLISPDTLDSLTPSSFRQLMSQKVTGDETALGKLITGTRWYFVTVLPAEDARRLSREEEITVRFSRDLSADIDMRVDSVGAEENGQCLAVLSADEFLSDTTLLRQQTVDLIFDSSTGIRVPKKALHLETETVTDEDGTERETQVYGVYAVVGTRAEFKPVEIVAESGDFYVVTSVRSDKTALRPGNEIILSAPDLYDGKVVR